jgi:hypothetical protein
MRRNEGRQEMVVEEAYQVEGDMREGYGDTGHLPKGQPNQRQSRDRVSVVRYQPYSVTTPTSPASQNNNQEVRCSSSPVVPRGPAVVVTLPQTYAAPVRRRFHKGFSSSTTSCFTTKDVPTSATSTGHTSQSSRRSDLVSLNDILELPLTLPLRLRGGGSTQNMPVTSTTDDVPLSASTSVSAASSEHDVNQIERALPRHHLSTLANIRRSLQVGEAHSSSIR